MSIAEVDEIFALDSGAQVWKVTHNTSTGHNNVPVSRTNCSLSVFIETENNPDPPIALIKCGDWYIGLKHGDTIIFRCGPTCPGVYIIPDAQNCDTYFVIILPSETASDLSTIELFEEILSYYSFVQDEPSWASALPSEIPVTRPPLQPQPTPSAPPPEPSATSAIPLGPPPSVAQPSSPHYPDLTPLRVHNRAEEISSKIVQGAEFINSSIATGAQYAEAGFRTKAAEFRSRPTTQQRKQIDPNILRTLRGLRVASRCAATVTGAAVSLVARGTHMAGEALAPHVRRHGTKLVSSVTGKSHQESGKFVDDALTVAAGGLRGFSILYNGITNTAKTLAHTFTTETVKIVDQRYGPEAARATEDALYTAGSAAITAQNVGDLGPKAVAKKVAKETGKQVVNGHANRNAQVQGGGINQPGPSGLQATSSPPNITSAPASTGTNPTNAVNGSIPSIYPQL